jgi:membrane protein YqaA with SNARE-associated domain
MNFLASPEASLIGLFISSFVSATLLPGNSEVVLFAVLRLHPDQAVAAFILATIGNTLGGLTTYAMSRLLPQKAAQKISPRHLGWVRRWGSAALLMAWAPLIGDALCVAAGWLRLPWWPCLVWMALGKGLRYGVIAAGALAW